MEGKQTYPHRSEILFLYDAFRCNPNGDPFENRPRQDPGTGKIDVTDVRLKRTVRDYLPRYKNYEIFVPAMGERALTAERRYEEIFGTLPVSDDVERQRQSLIQKCIDVRLFGALVPITQRGGEGGGIQVTGAAQFNPGQSLHQAEVWEIPGTGGFASQERARQKTFRREFIVPYALIGFYGVINENLAKDSGLTEEDVTLLMEAMWEGTLGLHSRSKAFHHPRLLVRLDYKDQRQCGYFIDRLKLIPLEGIGEKEIRSPKDYRVDMEAWLEEVKGQKDYLENIYCRIDPGISFSKGESPINLEQELKGLVKTS